MGRGDINENEIGYELIKAWCLAHEGLLHYYFHFGICLHFSVIKKFLKIILARHSGSCL